MLQTDLIAQLLHCRPDALHRHSSSPQRTEHERLGEAYEWNGRLPAGSREDRDERRAILRPDPRVQGRARRLQIRRAFVQREQWDRRGDGGRTPGSGTWGVASMATKRIVLLGGVDFRRLFRGVRGRRWIASSSSGRRNRQVRPSLRPGRMPRRAYSLTVYGLRSSRAATSATVSTSSRVMLIFGPACAVRSTS